MRQTKANSEQKTLDEILAVYDKQEEKLDDSVSTEEYPTGYIKELLERNRILLEALRKVKLLVERLLGQNRELKRKTETLEDEFKEQNKKGVRIVSAERYNEMQNNANELSRSLPKLIKLIKLLNQENKLVKDKYAALENEFEDLINERDGLKTKISILNETNQKEVLMELTELFPSEEIAAKVAKSISTKVDQTALMANNKILEVKSPETVNGIAPSFEQQTRTDLNQVAGFSNEQISKLVDLVMEINQKIENLSSSMVVSPAKRKARTELDLTDAITEADSKKSSDEPPDRPDLEEVLDDILISG